MVQITDSYVKRVGEYHNLYTIRRLNLLEIREKGYFGLRNVGKRFIYLFIFETACLKMYRIVVVFSSQSKQL